MRSSNLSENALTEAIQSYSNIQAESNLLAIRAVPTAPKN